MKLLISIVFHLSLAVLLTACDQKKSSDNSSIDPKPTDKTSKIPNYQWSPSGGTATVELNESFPFLQFIPSMDLEDLTTASKGRELFVAEWMAAPSSQPLLDGLGPLTITSACSNCHLSNGRAASLLDNGSIGVGLLFRLRDIHGNADPYYGGQLQTLATSGSSEGHVTWQFDKNKKPVFELHTNQLALTEGINLGPRLSPQLVGIGLLELVTDKQILELEDENDRDGDGISGRAHWHMVDGQKQLGRFGWKNMQPTLRGQSAGAMQQDMGLTTTVNPSEPCTAQQTVCNDQPNGGTPEVSDNSLDAINEFLTLLSVPNRRISDQNKFNEGAYLFEQVGCDNCHRPTLTTGDSVQYPILSQQVIYAYTDLLLHDMGADLSDGVKEGDAAPSEWRTPPLWSLGLIEKVEGSRFLHDGRAATIEEAIIWHGGEAEKTKQNYLALPADKRSILLDFVRSI